MSGLILSASQWVELSRKASWVLRRGGKRRDPLGALVSLMGGTQTGNGNIYESLDM